MTDFATRFDDLQEAIQSALDGRQAGMWSNLPFKVVKVNEDGQTGTIQPTIKSVVRTPDGKTELLEFPEIQDVPLHHMRGGGGGGHALTMPIKEGDEGLMQVSSRSMDVWEQQGDVQPQIDARMHDASDGFATVGYSSKPRRLKKVSKDSTQLRTEDSKAVGDVSAKGVYLRKGEKDDYQEKDSLLNVQEPGVISQKEDSKVRVISPGVVATKGQSATFVSEKTVEHQATKILLNC